MCVGGSVCLSSSIIFINLFEKGREKLLFTGEKKEMLFSLLGRAQDCLMQSVAAVQLSLCYFVSACDKHLYAQLCRVLIIISY